ncbi:site-2 protease family protein, partial [Francisella noatunensis subsp. orientalis]|nr:site-2 protease family protein [Francisella orientalis]
MDLNHILITILMASIPLIFAITIHEAAHGFIAKYRGDDTAYKLRRVTLNPVSHIDPIE